MALHGFTPCLDSLLDLLHPALIHYMTVYILPGFITWITASECILSWSSTCAITCAITCSRIHYMLPNPLHQLHAPESITCDQCSPFSIKWQRAWPAAAQQRPLCRPNGAISALGKQSLFCRIQFAGQYSSVQRLDLQHHDTDEVAASTRSLHNWSQAMQMVVGKSGAWEKRCLEKKMEYPGCYC